MGVIFGFFVDVSDITGKFSRTSRGMASHGIYSAIMNFQEKTLRISKLLPLGHLKDLTAQGISNFHNRICAWGSIRAASQKTAWIHKQYAIQSVT
jgi:hypothetical protein